MSRWLTLGALMAAAAAPVLGIQAGASSGTARPLLLACTALAAALGVGIATLQRLEVQGRRQEAEEAAEEARADFALALSGALGPTGDYLARLTVAERDPERQAVLGQLLQAALVAVVTVGPTGSRGCLYVLQPDGHVLERRGWSGRSGTPRLRLEVGTPEGDLALTLVRRGEGLLVPEVAAHPHRVPTADGSYDCLVAVPVTAGRERFGLLTLDAPGVGALTNTELELAGVLAALVGAGLALVEGVPSSAEEGR